MLIAPWEPAIIGSRHGARLMQRIVERHQIEGQDERQRVFNRLVDLQRTEKGYSAIFYYEGLVFETESARTVEETLRSLISKLQKAGFSNLRTRLNFRGPRYLAEREPWVNYPDSALQTAGRA
jgi:hypothetical protein